MLHVWECVSKQGSCSTNDASVGAIALSADGMHKLGSALVTKLCFLGSAFVIFCFAFAKLHAYEAWEALMQPNFIWE